MSDMEKIFRTPQTKKSAVELSRSDKARPEGDVTIKRYRNYYDISDTITTAQATNPNDEDNTNYNQEQVFVVLERNAEHITVSNDGADTLFVIASHQGGQSFSRERPIYPGENKTYFNIYELRLRSPTAGLAYRVTEYPICCNTSASALKTVQSILSNGTIVASGNSLSDAIDVRQYNFMTVTLRATMNGAATANPAARIEIITSEDNVNFDTVGIDFAYTIPVSLTLSAGNTRQKTSGTVDLRGINYIKVNTVNNDAAQSLTVVFTDIVLVK